MGVGSHWQLQNDACIVFFESAGRVIWGRVGNSARGAVITTDYVMCVLSSFTERRVRVSCIFSDLPASLNGSHLYSSFFILYPALWASKDWPLAWHLDACKSHIMVCPGRLYRQLGCPSPLVHTPNSPPAICKRYLGSCLGSLKGELNTESVCFWKGPFVPWLRSERGPLRWAQPLCRQNEPGSLQRPLDRKQTCGEFVHSRKHYRCGQAERAGNHWTWNTFV